jgi:hypothetical protein
LWVKHEDKGRVELHFVIPNVELVSGKRLQPYYHRADLKRVDNWKRLINHDFGLSDPDSPDNVRTQSISHDAPKTRKEEAEQVKSTMEELYMRGEVRSRSDVVKALTGMGYTVRGKKVLSIKRDYWKKAIRLKGALYELDVRPINEVGEYLRGAKREYDNGAYERIKRARSELREQLKKRFIENRRQYPQELRGDKNRGHKESKIEAELAWDRFYHSSSAYNVLEYSSESRSTRESHSTEVRNFRVDGKNYTGAFEVPENSPQADIRGKLLQRRERGLSVDSKWVQPGVDLRRKTLRETKGVLRNDGNRETSNGKSKEPGSTLQRARGNLNKAIKRLGKGLDEFGRALKGVRFSAAKLAGAVQKSNSNTRGLAARLSHFEEEIEYEEEYRIRRSF